MWPQAVDELLKTTPDRERASRVQAPPGRRRGRFFGASYPLPSSPSVTTRMVANRGRNTRPEMLLRSTLHLAGLRFRVHYPVRVDAGRPIVIDIAFPGRRVAVFVDGCFWHACSKHRSIPKANRDYWRPKLARNSERDRETGARLEHAGWIAIRIWEHEDVGAAASCVSAAVAGSDSAISVPSRAPKSV
jgi:DNA mismatch endonuclease (patch repair protein)